MTDPGRAARVWAVEAGGAGEPAGLPAVPRPLGLLKEGLARRLVALVRGEPLPRGDLRPLDRLLGTWLPDPLTEQMMNPR